VGAVAGAGAIAPARGELRPGRPGLRGRLRGGADQPANPVGPGAGDAPERSERGGAKGATANRRRGLAAAIQLGTFAGEMAGGGEVITNTSPTRQRGDAPRWCVGLGWSPTRQRGMRLIPRWRVGLFILTRSPESS